jgi:tetratricopeptide (TPR) repeat protein
MDDLDLLKRSLILARNPLPLNIQVNEFSAQTEKHEKMQKNSKEKNFTETELTAIAQKLELFNMGYELLLDVISQKAKEGFFQAHPDLESISVEALLDNDDIYDEAVEELINSNFDYTVYLNEIFEYEDSTILNFYQIAVQLYDNAQTEKAILAFTFLTYIHPRISSFWKGLGLSHERNQNFIEAVRDYKMAVERSESFDPYYDMIRCCEKCGDFNEALILLEKLKEKGLFQAEVENAFIYVAQQKFQ